MSPKKLSLNLVKICDLKTGETKKEWLVDGLWDYAGTGILFAPPKTGKTWLLLELAVSVATGTKFLDRFKTKQGKVFLHSPEGSRHDLKERIRQVCGRKNLPLESADIEILNQPYFAIDNRANQQLLEKEIKRKKPILLAFDPLIECFEGNENMSDDVRKFSKWFTRLAHQYSLATILAHHTNGSGGLRGSSALFGFGTAYWSLGKSAIGKTTLNFEFKNRKPLEPLPLKLETKNGFTSFTIARSIKTKTPDPPQKELVDNINHFLSSKYPVSLTMEEIRKTLGGLYNQYPSALKYLVHANLITRLKNNKYKSKRGGKEKL